MRHRCILFNGPPRSGKDTAANIVLANFDNPIYRDRFSMPLKSSILSWFGESIGSDFEKYLESRKDEPEPLLGGLSYREAQIDLSEKYIKPLYGKTAFGDWQAHRCKRFINDANRIFPADAETLTLIPDSGFSYEAGPIVELYGPANVLLMRLHRDGASFSRDSRAYIELPDITTVDVWNNSGIDELRALVVRHVSNWMKTS